MNNVIYMIYGLYILAAIIWTGMVLSLKLFEGLSFFVVAIPYLAFALNFYNAGKSQETEEINLFQGNFLSIGLIVIVSVMGWFANMGIKDNKQIALILLCLALALFSHIDLGVPQEYVIVYRHYRSILQTFSITLFLIVIVNYFTIEENPFLSKYYTQKFSTNPLVVQIKSKDKIY